VTGTCPEGFRSSNISAIMGSIRHKTKLKAILVLMERMDCRKVFATCSALLDETRVTYPCPWDSPEDVVNDVTPGRLLQ